VNNAVLALLLLVASGTLGILGLWQLLAGGTRSAQLAARGQISAAEGSGRNIMRAVDARLRRTESGRRFAAWVAGAGIPMLPAEVLGIGLAASLLVFVIAAKIVAAWLAFLVAFGGSALAARAWIEHKRGNRVEAFVAQLPELARMLANGTSAGLSMPQAVRMTSRELAEPAGSELKRVVDEMQVGRSIEDSLEALRERLPSREVSVLMSTIVIQQRGGGDTVRALGELASTLEARKDLRREIHTLLSGVVFTSYLVAFIGAAAVVLINLMFPGVMKEITSRPIGIAAIVVSATLWTIGWVLIRRTTRVEV
jgi:tight adherence protein B